MVFYNSEPKQKCLKNEIMIHMNLIVVDVMFPGNIDAMFPGNIDGMFPGNINSEGNCNYYCMSRETISTNHVAVFYVEM